MKMNSRILLVIFIVIAETIAVRKSYDGYKVYKVVPKSRDEVNNLLDIQKSGVGDFWNDYFDTNHNVNVMVSPEQQLVFLGKMKETKIEVNEVIGDLQRLIDDQLKPSSMRNSESFLSYNWNEYHDLDKIYAWLDELEENYPDIVSTVIMGKSVEDRDIKGIIINYRPQRNDTLIGMFEGTLHAREWISAATVTWIIKEFLSSTDPAVRALAENFEWHIFPVVNPDGYTYSFTDNRMWRKNRSNESATSCGTGIDDDMSKGVDLNRNFDFVWMSIGATNDSCSNLFAGPTSFSEPESRAIAQYVLDLKRRGEIIYYIAFHSYSQLILVPYSHVSGNDVLLANNYADMYEIAIRSSAVLEKRFGTAYKVGVSADVMYQMSGTSFDWVKYAADVPVTYLFELRDLGEYGFLLPAEQIIPNNLEIMDALIEIHKTTKTLGYFRSGASNVLSSIFIVTFSVALFVM